MTSDFRQFGIAPKTIVTAGGSLVPKTIAGAGTSNLIKGTISVHAPFGDVLLANFKLKNDTAGDVTYSTLTVKAGGTLHGVISGAVDAASGAPAQIFHFAT